jgi:hypothetical protein
LGLLPENLGDGVPSVVIAIAAGKHDDAKLHRDTLIISGLAIISGAWAARL